MYPLLSGIVFKYTTLKHACVLLGNQNVARTLVFHKHSDNEMLIPLKSITFHGKRITFYHITGVIYFCDAEITSRCCLGSEKKDLDHQSFCPKIVACPYLGPCYLRR